MELTSGDRIRFLHINTPETGEPGAKEATEFVRKLVMDREVELRFGRVMQDRYGRYLAEIFVDNVSVNEALVQNGWAHGFFIPPVNKDAYKRIVKAQIEARNAKRGIWSSDPRYKGPFHITSFHHDAPGDDRKNLNGEYIRIANISVRPENLAGYSLVNRLGRTVGLPRIMVPVARTISIHSGTGRSQLDHTRGQQVCFLKQTNPLWRNKGDVVTLKSPKGVEVDSVRSKKARFFGKKKK
jgi:micrococcal nuclease